MPVVTEAILSRVALEEQLLSMAGVEIKDNKAEGEFLVTRTVGNKEVWENLIDWEDSIRAEHHQLVFQKEAVKQMPKSKLYEVAEAKQLPIELLPGKMVHTGISLTCGGVRQLPGCKLRRELCRRSRWKSNQNDVENLRFEAMGCGRH